MNECKSALYTFSTVNLLNSYYHQHDSCISTLNKFNDKKKAYKLVGDFNLHATEHTI